MAQSRKVLKFRSTLPFHLESMLVNKFGYAVEQRVQGQYIIFTSHSPKETKSNIIRPAAFAVNISIARQAELIRRCDNIVDMFPDPYNQEKAIRTRLHNMSQTLPPYEQQLVIDYMDDNFPLADKGK